MPNRLAIYYLAFFAATAAATVVQGAVFVPAAQGSTQRHRHRQHGKDVPSAANAMNSIDFLRQLVQQKSTSEVQYYESPVSHSWKDDATTSASVPSATEEGTEKKSHFFRKVATKFRGETQKVPPAVRSHRNHVRPDRQSHRPNTSTAFTTEYVGNVSSWVPVLRSTGIRFRETVSVSHLPADGSSATIECLTQFQRNEKWINCSRVVCTLMKVEGGIDIRADSDLLVPIPLGPVAGRAVRAKISAAFEEAAESFFAADAATVAS